MKKITLLILLLISTKLFGQNKAETSEWIIDKFMQYEIESMSNNSIEIIDEMLIYFEYTYDKNFRYHLIPIKNIKTIKISRKTQYGKVSYLISLIGKGKHYGNFKEGFYSEYPNSDIMDKEERGINLFLNQNFGENQMPTRMEKALLNLVRLYGGSAVIGKEAF